MSICNCPLGASLQSVDTQACPWEFGQLQRILVMRIKANDGDLNELAEPAVLATWTSAKSSEDSGKVVTLPTIFNPSITPGESKIFGENSNETPDGAGIVMGETASTLAGNFSQQQPSVIQAIKSFECENIGIFIINAAGHIYGKKGKTEGAIRPIPAKSFFVKAPELGSSETPTKSEFQFKMEWDWYHDLLEVKPTDFDALLEL